MGIDRPAGWSFMDKRNPWIAVAWSLLMPGPGHLYTYRIPTSFYLLTWWVGTSFLGHFLPAVHMTLAGDFAGTIAVIKPEWFLFLIPIYPFSMYDRYANTVEYNKLFDQEQSRFQIDNYQNPKFPMPIGG